jgi:hypothetical protein
MAALIGIDWPVNSVGVLPDVNPNHPGYLLPRGGEKSIAHAALVNARVRFLFLGEFPTLGLKYGYYRSS